ncbi:MAG: DUF4959 domain-containing protein [Dysgonamonadaceae bacterium]|jgi:hypothetical protein|nr:DUF4959 domain-containing protein [Dysgonamonadaceae bacterium]
MRKINHKSIVEASLVFALFGMLCLTGCGQEEKLGLDPTDSAAPAPPTGISVENIGGGAIISFSAPKDDDLLCVVASYMINGQERTTKSSPYVNKLKVEGFGSEGEFQVALKSVDKSKNESEPVSVTVSPLTPPVKLVFQSLKVVDSFGGVKLSWENTMESNIIVEAFRKDVDEWVSVENFYSNAQVGLATIRGYDPEPVTFRFRIRDRWDNYSDFLETNNLPLEETQLEKSRFRMVTALPGDSPSHGTLVISNIWDNKVHVSNSCYHGNGGASSPEMDRTITFDMGQTARISRFKMWQRTESDAFIYSHNNLKHYVIYGCNELTPDMYDTNISGKLDPDKNIWYPTFNGWTKVLDVWCRKPSGDSGVVTNEDKEYILGGDEHEVPIEIPPFRYVRILFLENWSGGTIAQIGEMTFWGQIIN